MKSEKTKNKKLAIIPVIKLILKHLLPIFFALSFPYKDNSSATTLVVTILMPEHANVMPNIYTDIIKENTPKASLPILFEIYILNINEIILKIRELIIINIVLNINFFNLFIVKYM